MAKKLFVSGLTYATHSEELVAFFTQPDEKGTVLKIASRMNNATGEEELLASVVYDRETGRSRGFAFVEMETEEEAVEAINRFNGQELGGRTVGVSEARPKPEGAQSGNRFNSGSRPSFNSRDGQQSNYDAAA